MKGLRGCGLALMPAAASSGCPGPTCFGGCNEGGPPSPKIVLGSFSGLDAGIATDPNPCELDLDFAALALGEMASATIDVYNTGESSLDLAFGNSGLGPGFWLSEGNPAPISPGGFYSFSVAFRPSDAGPLSSTFDIETNGINATCPAPFDGYTSSLVVSLVGSALN